MTRVACSVENCAYNKNYQCHANGIIVSPKGGLDNQITCCGSFLDNNRYANLANCSMIESSNEYVQCKVGDCKFYAQGHCTRSTIQIEQDAIAQSYIETYCGSFEDR